MSTASAPATTANLGPGFDRLAMADGRRCTVTAQVGEKWHVEHLGGIRPADGEPDGVLLAAKRAVGDGTPLEITVDTEIPIGKGLGSSAAAYVAGVAAALAAVGEEPTPDRVFRYATDLEGHPDQTAAAVYGGLILVPAEGEPMRLPLHPSLRPIVAVPPTTLATRKAREVIDRAHSHDVVLRTISRVASLIAGLITGDSQLLASAHGDEIHEAPRAALSPEVGEMMTLARRAGALHAARSGAGPSVVAFATSDSAPSVVAAMTEFGCEVIEGPMETSGLVVDH
jgi:homoserine kinase